MLDSQILKAIPHYQDHKTFLPPIPKEFEETPPSACARWNKTSKKYGIHSNESISTKNEKENERLQYIIDLYNKKIQANDLQIEEEIKLYLC